MVPLFLRDRAHSSPTKPHRQQPVVTRRLTTALQMSKDQRPRLLLRTLFDLVRKPFRDSADSDRLAGHRLPSYRRTLSSRGCALSDYYNREVPARAATRGDLFTH